jgi:uncharacterized protein (TIGR03067 family)
MKRTTILPIVLLLAAVSAVNSGDAAKDQKELQGVWESDEKPTHFVLTITGNKWEMKEKDKPEFFFKGTFTLDAKAKPNAMDMKFEEGGKEIEIVKGKTALAIYELAGDTLKWAANEPGDLNRPKDFAAKGRIVAAEFKRVK